MLVDLDDGDVHRSVGAGEFVTRGGRDGVPGADDVLGQREPEPDGLAPGRVLDAPGGGQRRAHQQPAAALVVRVGVPLGARVGRVGEGGQAALGVVVGDLDADEAVLAQTAHLGVGAGVHDGIGDEFADQDDGVVDDLGQAPAEQGVANESARGCGRPVYRSEGGGCARGDHVATSPLLWPGRPPRTVDAPGPTRLLRLPGGGPESGVRPGAALHPTFRLVPRGYGAPKQAPESDSAHVFGQESYQPCASGRAPGASAVRLGGPQRPDRAVRSKRRRWARRPPERCFRRAGACARKVAGGAGQFTMWEGPVEFGHQGRNRHDDVRRTRWTLRGRASGRRRTAPEPQPGRRARRPAQAAGGADGDARRQLQAAAAGGRAAGGDRRGLQRGGRAQPAPHR